MLCGRVDQVAKYRSSKNNSQLLGVMCVFMTVPRCGMLCCLKDAVYGKSVCLSKEVEVILLQVSGWSQVKLARITFCSTDDDISILRS
jgi:hypothetical protein